MHEDDSSPSASSGAALEAARGALPAGWSRLLEEASPADLPEVLHAYSECMPPPRLGLKPSGALDDVHRIPGDELGWAVPEHEEHLELRPGLERVARHVLQELSELAHGVRTRISRSLVHKNPAFPERLATSDAALARESFAIAFPVALSKTQDERGRVRWTLFGASHEGPGRAFWKSFDPASGVEDGEALFRRWAAWTLRVPEASLADLAAAGIRVLPADPDPDLPAFGWEPIPEFARPLLLGDEEPLAEPMAIVTFRLFERLPRRVQEAYLAGAVRLLPCPHSLLFWGHPGYRALARELPRATQIPLLQIFGRSEDTGGFRIPQSGWLDENVEDPETSVDGGSAEHPMRRRVRRTHRWQHGDAPDDPTLLDDPVTLALFSSHPDDLHLYGKPMAKSAQVWTERYEKLLDGASATAADIESAALSLKGSGRFGYRFHWPPMRVGPREVFWHRPLLARLGDDGAPEIFPWPGLCGFLTAELDDAASVELWPRLQARDEHLAAVALAEAEEVPPRARGSTTRNVRKLLEWPELLGRKPSPSLARALLAGPRDATLDDFLASLPAGLRESLAARIGEPEDEGAPLTFGATATRAFEERWWSAVATLAEGGFLTRNVADTVAVNEGRYPPGRPPLPTERHLDLVGEHLHRFYAERIAAHGMEGAALCADHVFRWQTFHDFSWSAGWRRSREGEAAERNVIVVIPGRDRSRAVILADHYDTAYMEDLYYPARGGTRLRMAAAGADDNASATATLQLAADVLLPLAKAGALACDVWLVHLTGEEFPADCLGARALGVRLARRELALRTRGGRKVDLSGVQVDGAIVLDMIAHNAERARDVFQIATGEGAGAARLARTVHLANLAWNKTAAERNQTPERRRAGRFARQESGRVTPPPFRHLALTGEIRPGWDPRSALYNTDAQIFSDLGIPAVLLMENYELLRSGYHDSKDDMSNIDLDYGAAMAAIAIEAIARAATDQR